MLLPNWRNSFLSNKSSTSVINKIINMKSMKSYQSSKKLVKNLALMSANSCRPVKYILGICLLGRKHYDCTAGAVFSPGDVSATCGQVLATSGMVPLNAYQELRQCYLVNENNPVGWFWLCP